MEHMHKICTHPYPPPARAGLLQGWLSWHQGNGPRHFPVVCRRRSFSSLNFCSPKYSHLLNFILRKMAESSSLTGSAALARGEVIASPPEQPQQQPTPASSAQSAKPDESSTINGSDNLLTTPRPTRTSGRKRARTPDYNDEGDPEPETPARSTKKARTARTPAKTPAQKAEADAEKARKKAEVDAEKARKKAEQQAKKDAKAAETQRKKDIKQWKDDWKNWVAAHQTDEKLDSFEEECLTATRCKDYFKIAGDELKCLPHDEKPNPNGPYAPMKLYKYEEVEALAYKKEAILAGVAQDDEVRLIAKGKELWEKEKG